LAAESLFIAEAGAVAETLRPDDRRRHKRFRVIGCR